MDPKKSPQTREALLAELREETQYVGFDIDRAAINAESRTVDLAWCSELPYDRWWGIEILDCSAKSVHMDRMRNNAALLLNHDTGKQIGVVEKATLDKDKKGRARVRFSRSALGEEIFADVTDGIRTKVSVGYRINDLVLEKKEGDVSTYRVTDWTPYEISIVPVPADDTVGVGRGHSGQPEKAKAMTQEANEQSRASSGSDPAKQLAADFSAGNEAARADERSRFAAMIREITAIGAMWPEYDGPALAAKACGDSNMTADAFRQVMLDVVAKNKAAKTVTGKLEADRKEGDQADSVSYGMGARDMLHASNLLAFKGVGKLMRKEDHEVAYRAGMWAKAVLYQDGGAARWCNDHGVRMAQGSFDNVRTMTEGVFTSAGWLVPIEMESAIIANREQYGVARRICNVIPMSSASLVIPRVTSDITAYFVGEGVGGTASDSAGDQVTLNLKDLMTYTKIGKSTASDSAVPLAEMVAQEQARAFAIKEDACLFVGDGTSTYGGMMGIKTMLDLAGYAGGKAVAASGHNLLTEQDVTDITSLIAKLPVYARNGARFVCSGVSDAVIFGRLKLNAGGNDRSTVQGEILEGSYAGFPITIAHNLPSGAATDYASQLIVVLGNFKLGVAFGSGDGMMMTVDPYTLAEQNLTRIITSERIDIVAHGVNASTTVAGPIVGLHATT